MSSVSTGRQAEQVAADYLQNNGFSVIDRNWRTRYCEIDLVAVKDHIVYFVEVKYRRTTYQGAGMDYITPKKLQQMQFAANMWVNNKHWLGDYRLAAVEVSGPDFTVTSIIV